MHSSLLGHLNQGLVFFGFCNPKKKSPAKEADYPEPLPPGLDEFLVEDGGILSCCMQANGTCDIDVIPPL